MIRDVDRWRAFEAQLSSGETLNLAEKFRILDGMYELARKLGKFTSEDAMDGIEKTLRVARVINSVRRTP